MLHAYLQTFSMSDDDTESQYSRYSYSSMNRTYEALEVMKELGLQTDGKIVQNSSNPAGKSPMPLCGEVEAPSTVPQNARMPEVPKHKLQQYSEESLSHESDGAEKSWSESGQRTWMPLTSAALEDFHPTSGGSMGDLSKRLRETEVQRDALASEVLALKSKESEKLCIMRRRLVEEVELRQALEDRNKELKARLESITRSTEAPQALLELEELRLAKEALEQSNRDLQVQLSRAERERAGFVDALALKEELQQKVTQLRACLKCADAKMRRLEEEASLQSAEIRAQEAVDVEPRQLRKRVHRVRFAEPCGTERTCHGVRFAEPCRTERSCSGVRFAEPCHAEQTCSGSDLSCSIHVYVTT